MLRIFRSKHIAVCVGLIFIQQIIVAFSTIFIGELAKSIANGYISWVYLSLFIFSLVIVYVPATLSRVYLEIAKFEARGDYINQFVNSYRGKIHLNSKDEEQKLPYLTTEGQTTIDAAAFFFFDALSIVLNIAASLVALAYIIHPVLLLSYSVSFVLLSIFMYFSNEKIESSSRLAQSARAASLTQLLNSWRNIVVNNSYNFAIWKERFERTFKESMEKNVRNQTIKQVVSSAGMLISLFPLLGTLGYLLYANSGYPAFLALIVATLPRQIQMIQNMDIVVQYLTEWSDLKQRLLGLKLALQPNDQRPEKRIQWDNIEFHTPFEALKISSVDSLSEIISSPGRITIRGENGTGKTTLLKCIKEKFGGYYLPANPNLSFACKNWQQLSTGEQILTALQEVCAGNHFEKLLLLDEWDANLDTVNREKLSKVIDKLSNEATVIEAVHRHR